MSVSVVIPTKNRLYTMKKVLPSYLEQPLVHEIIIVDDGGHNDYTNFLSYLNEEYPSIRIKYIKHNESRGAAASRITGYNNATFDYVLFGEDDAFLSSGYVDVLFDKLKLSNKVALVSGQIVYMNEKESIEAADHRFDTYNISDKYINYSNLMIDTNIILPGDTIVSFTHALFMTRKELLLKYGYDPYYGKGNGFREETDFQLACYVDNLDVFVTPDTRCFHLNRNDVPSGGQRSNHLVQIYYAIKNTFYLYKKYYSKLQTRRGLKQGSLMYPMSEFIYSYILKRYTLSVCKKITSFFT